MPRIGLSYKCFVNNITLNDSVFGNVPASKKTIIFLTGFVTVGQDFFYEMQDLIELRF